MKRLILLLPLLGLLFTARAQVPFNGLIVDGDGKGIKARISVLHSNKRTLSDKAGRFGLTDLGPSDTLEIRYRNDRITIPVADRRSMRIVWMTEQGVSEATEAPELADYGFGYVKRREKTSDSTGISGEMMIRRGFSDLQTAILALVPGVHLVNGELVIRGIGSVNSGSSALILCDGLTVSSLHNINIRDVESVEVIKGANMYGFRGVNGVISIRTRKL